MYLRHYGLREAPFELTANPGYLYLAPAHREALANLRYGLKSAKAITLLLGEAGTGKTTLLRAALDSEMCRSVCAVTLTNPCLTREEFVEALARGFQLSDEAAGSKTALLLELETMLRRRLAGGETTALIVDEAQRLSDELLEEIRLLANVETDTEKLLPLVLVGQPELGDRLNQPSLRQLKQRVALRCEVAALSLAETAAYIAHRIRSAGGDAGRLFSREAVVLVHQCSRGIPRTVSVMCDNALLCAFAAGRHRVECDIVREVAHDFDLPAPGVPDSAGPSVVAPARQSPGKPADDRQAVPVDGAADDEPQHAARGGRIRRFSVFGSW